MLSLLRHKDGLLLFIFVNSNDLAEAQKNEWFDAPYYCPSNHYHLLDQWLPLSFTQATSRAQWARRIKAGLNSPYFPEIWAGTTAL